MASLQAGIGKIDTTPPVGIELAGYHKPADQPRLIESIRKPTAVRALVLDDGKERCAIISIDILAVSPTFNSNLRIMAANATGIPAAHIYVCATHTHSMPTFLPLLQWGAVPLEYEARIADACVESVRVAIADLSPSDLYIGREPVVGGNFNRTRDTAKTDAEFDPSSTDADRWLDTQLHALVFVRDSDKGDRVVYHFSAHPVCYDDAQAGPDWPGNVAETILSAHKSDPLFLQGHCGDVNPGDGTPWRGDMDETTRAVFQALHHAIGHGELAQFSGLTFAETTVDLPFDLEALKSDLAAYRSDPAAHATGEWVDAGFVAAWADSMKDWPEDRKSLQATLSAVALGNVVFLFHGAELFSYYGLRIRADSPFAHTIAVGYSGDFVGYVGDPVSYEKREYSAVTVPRILGWPPFASNVGALFTAACGELLKKLKAASG